MLKKVRKKDIKNNKGNKIIKEYIAFGNRKKVFWSITIITIILSIIGIPIIIKNQNVLKQFLIIWILEIIYIGFYTFYKRKSKGMKK